MTARDPSVSVVICAYTERRWLAILDAVASVRGQSRPPLEVIVSVDHNPSLLERLRAELDGVALVENREQRGLSGARNSGVAAAAGEVVAFLDDDAVADADWLRHLAGGYAGADVLGVGGLVEASWVDGRPRSFPREFDWVVGCSYAGLPTSPGPVRNLIGANMSVRRDVLGAVGGFRAGIGRVGTRPVGCEETELCIRAAAMHPGGRFLYEPRARVLHTVPPERAAWRYFRSRCFAEGLSKAAVVQGTGRGPGLASERAYTTRTLPHAFARGLADAVVRGDLAGAGRAGAIATGLALTTAGFLAGTLDRRLPAGARRRPPLS